MKISTVLFLVFSFIGLNSQDYTIPENLPGVQFENMVPMIGKWKVTYQMNDEKDQKSYGSGTNEIYFQLNGRIMVIRSINIEKGMSFESYSYISYDKVNSEYFLFRYDNLVYSRIHLTGKYDEKTRTFTFEGKLINKDKNPIKIVYQLERDNKITGTIYLDEGNGLQETYKEILIKQE